MRLDPKRYVLTGKAEWCYPARNREGHVDVKSISKQIGDRQTMFKKGRDGGPRKPMMHRRSDNTLMLNSGKAAPGRHMIYAALEPQ